MALTLCLAATPPSFAGSNQWRQSTIAGAAAYKELRFGDAERAFQKSIEEAKKYGPDSIKLAVSLANLGVLYNYRGFFDKAEKLFEESVDIQKRKLGVDNPDYISASGKLCQFYLKREKYEKAKPYAEKVITYGEGKLKELDALKSDQSQKDKLTKEELDIKKKKHNRYLELAVLYDRMGTAYLGHKENGRYLMSEKLFTLSKDIREKVLSGNHLALSSSYENLGRVYLNEGRYSKAEPLLKKGYYLSKKTLGFTNPKTYSKLDLWNKSLMGLGRYSQAESHYRLALTSFSKEYGTKDGHVANIETSLAHLLARRGRYSQAAHYMGKAIKIKEKISGPHHASLITPRKEYQSMLRKAHHRTSHAPDDEETL